MRTIHSLLALLLIAGTCCVAQGQQTKVLTADKHNEYGLVYTLPRTALRIVVTATRTVSQTGPYWQYAKKYIGTDRVVKADAEQWEIADVRVTPYGVADTENQYLMQLKPGALTSICVADDNMLLGINKEVSYTEPPVVNVTRSMSLTERPRMDAYLEFVDEDFISSQSSAKQAQMLAESLMEVRDAKVSLSRGTADSMPTDGRQLELMLASLARQERAFTNAFTGIVTTDTVTRTYTYIPGEADSATLFRMSDFAGFVEADDYSGDPVTIAISDRQEGSLPVNADGEEKRLPKDAVIYAIPGSAKVTLGLDGDTLWSGTLDFAQYGTTFGLQPSLFSDRKSRSFAIFDPVTGALKEIGNVGE